MMFIIAVLEAKKVSIWFQYVVVRSSTSLKRGKENDVLLGDDKATTFFKVIKLTTKYDQIEASIRPDLSYYSSKKE